MNESRWWSYVERVSGGAALSHVAERSGFDKSALSRWKRGDRPDPYFVVKFARGLGLPVVEALAEAGLITDEEASMREVQVGVENLDIVQLSQELAERLRQLKRDGWEPVELPSELDAPTKRRRDAARHAAVQRRLAEMDPLPAVAHDPGVAPEDDAEDERD